MESNIKTVTTKPLEIFDYWKQIPIGDIDPLKLNQKIDSAINTFVDYFDDIASSPDSAYNRFISFEWAVSVRDFTILLRDTILACTKYEQFKKDDKKFRETYLVEVQEILQKAAKEVSEEYYNIIERKTNFEIFKHQESPIREIVNQLAELQKQAKKIFRSSGKIDDIRGSIAEYVRDFQLQYAKQTNAVDELFAIVDEIRKSVKTISAESSELKIEKIVERIGDNSQKLELILGTESIDILPYTNKETLSIPVSTSEGNLKYKSINIKSEFARWFSSFIYPRVVELESKRDQAVEKSLLLMSQIRAKIAAFSMSDVDFSVDFQREFEGGFLTLEREALNALKKEVDEMNSLVVDYKQHYLIASNVYSNEFLFLPESRKSQISNLSKDAQKRLVSHLEEYSGSFKSYLNKVLSRYFEIDKTPYSQFVKNKLAVYDQEDSMALFLKNGYLGKSFTVPRPELINQFLDDYNLWLEGFTGAMLFTGLTGSGKSTVLGMINHLGLNEENIQLKTKESYFIEHRSYEPIYDLKELIEVVLRKTRSRRIIISIDDLDQWHDDENDLFDNINKLFEAIIKYRRRVFFIVTCSPFLKRRIELFKDFDSIFSSRVIVGKMNAKQIKSALNLRARINEKVMVEDSNFESRINNIVRESRGNMGYAMMEYCRYQNESYKPNVKSQEFTELIKTYQTLLTYICSYHHCSIKRLSDFLSELDFRDTIKSIDHLVGQKILVRPITGYIAINPLLVHTVELTLQKIKK